jgi:hypothetical protein
MPASLTEQAGVVAVQFFITEPSGNVTATAVQTFKVKAGIFPTKYEGEDVFQELRTQMSKIESNSYMATLSASNKVPLRHAGDERQHVYTFDKMGSGEKLINEQVPSAGEIAGYDQNGNLKTNAPTQDTDAVNKNYADANYATKIEIDVDSQTYVVTVNLKNLKGEIISSGEIDLPLESVVTGATYDSDSEELKLGLQNGEEISVKISSLIKGLLNAKENDGTNTELYGYCGKEQVSIKLSKSSVANAIVQYDDEGGINLNAPTKSTHAVNKQYVDTAFGMQSIEDYVNSDVSVVVQPNTEYYYGILTALNLGFSQGQVGDSFYMTFKTSPDGISIVVDQSGANLIAPLECSENAIVEVSGVMTNSGWNVCWREI